MMYVKLYNKCYNMEVNYLHLAEANILAAAMTLFGMKTVHDTPSHDMFKVSPDADSLKRQVLLQATSVLVSAFVDTTFAQDDTTQTRC